MTYTLTSVPEDKEVWCTGFRFDDTKAGINCRPVQGSIHNKDYWNSKFKTKNRTISVNTINRIMHLLILTKRPHIFIMR